MLWTIPALMLKFHIPCTIFDDQNRIRAALKTVERYFLKFVDTLLAFNLNKTTIILLVLRK